MDSDYCLICDKKTLGGMCTNSTKKLIHDSQFLGIYCSQQCRLLDLEHNALDTLQLQTLDLTSKASSTTSSPAASPQFAPTRSKNLPSLPILNSLDRFINRSTSTQVLPQQQQQQQQHNHSHNGSENTSIWRRRSILFYTT